MEMNELDSKINEQFAGLVVRKDLVNLVKGNAIVPTYVLEYLLGQYCATSDEASIQSGVETVREILRKHYVHRNEAGLIQSVIRERGRHKVIDKISVALNDKKDIYEATFANLGLRQVPVSADVTKRHPKLLVSGVWCLADVEYMYSDDRDSSPWILDTIKPIQLSRFDFEGYLAARRQFTTEEWIDLIMQSIGFDPQMFERRGKLLQLVRLIPFCERNYNLIELGPKGTGKSHIYSEFSPHGILISGGEVTVAKLFVNNATGKIGLVGYWDTVAFDEFAGRKKRANKALVDILKNYMANKSFSRGIETLGAEASMVYVGNTQHNVAYMLQHADLFSELPAQYYDSAFLDRIHFYLPGWEVDIIRGEMFSDGYGFVVDYLAEILRFLRDHDYSQLYSEQFELFADISTRDRTAIQKTFSGLMKILFPHQEATDEETEEMLRFAIEGRKRVKDQLMRIDSTYADVSFGYMAANQERVMVQTLEEEQYPRHYSRQIIDSDSGLDESANNEDIDRDKESVVKKDADHAVAPGTESIPRNSAESIAALIAQGESHKLEFKSTFQYDVKQKQLGVYLRDMVVKTVAAYLNSKGGILLIGVEDDGEIFGIEQDLKLVKGHSLDRFELTLTSVLTDNIGKEFAPFIDMLRSIFTQPGMLLDHLFVPYRSLLLLKLLLPLGFLSLLSPAPLLIGLPALAYNMLSETPSQSSIYFQYLAPVVPFIIIAAIQGAGRIQRWLSPGRARWVLTAWITLGLLLAWIWDNPFTKIIEAPYFPVYGLQPVADKDAFDQARALLPPEAPVATMMAYGPHLSLRPELHLFYDRLKLQERPFGFPQTEYLLLNLTDLRWGVNARFFYSAIETAIGQFGYEALYAGQDVVLLHQTDEPQPQTGAVLARVIELLDSGGKYAPAAQETIDWMGRQWVTNQLPQSVSAQSAQFEDGITLLGYDAPADRQPGQPLCVTLYWQAGSAVTEDYTVFLHLAASDGFVQAQRDTPPIFGFYPTSRWQPGEIVADMHCLQLPPSLAPGQYTLLTGLYNPKSGKRLQLTSETSQADNALNLGHVELASPAN